MSKDIYMDSYAVEIYLGEKRSGKTLSMVAKTFNDLKELDFKPTIYTNIWLNPKYFDKYCNIISIKENEKEFIISLWENQTILENSIFIIDELHRVCDSRNFMSKLSKAFAYFIGQIGKRKNILRGTTHFFTLIDYRIRNYCERIIKIEKGLIIGNKFKRILNYNKRLNQTENEIMYIKNITFIKKIYGFESYDIQDEVFYVKASKYFDYYNTEELVI